MPQGKSDYQLTLVLNRPGFRSNLFSGCMTLGILLTDTQHWACCGGFTSLSANREVII